MVTACPRSTVAASLRTPRHGGLQPDERVDRRCSGNRYSRAPECPCRARAEGHPAGHAALAEDLVVSVTGRVQERGLVGQEKVERLYPLELLHRPGHVGVLHSVAVVLARQVAERVLEGGERDVDRARSDRVHGDLKMRTVRLSEDFVQLVLRHAYDAAVLRLTGYGS
jgi:hypothetical protein